MSLVYAVELKLPHLLTSVVTEVLQLTECELVSFSLSLSVHVWTGDLDGRCVPSLKPHYLIPPITLHLRNSFKNTTWRERSNCYMLWVGLQPLPEHPPRLQSNMAVPPLLVHPWKWYQHQLTQETLLRTCLACMMESCAMTIIKTFVVYGLVSVVFHFFSLCFCLCCLLSLYVLCLSILICCTFIQCYGLDFYEFIITYVFLYYLYNYVLYLFVCTGSLTTAIHSLFGINSYLWEKLRKLQSIINCYIHIGMHNNYNIIL